MTLSIMLSFPQNIVNFHVKLKLPYSAKNSVTLAGPEGVWIPPMFYFFRDIFDRAARSTNVFRALLYTSFSHM